MKINWKIVGCVIGGILMFLYLGIFGLIGYSACVLFIELILSEKIKKLKKWAK